MKKLINLTNDALYVMNEKGEVKILWKEKTLTASGGINVVRTGIELQGVPIYTADESVVKLPPHQQDVLYIVEKHIFDALANSRGDILTANTYGSLAGNKIQYVTSWRANTKFIQHTCLEVMKANARKPIFNSAETMELLKAIIAD